MFVFICKSFSSFITIIIIAFTAIIISAVMVSDAIREVKSYNTSTALLGNVTDLLVDIDEYFKLSCDGSVNNPIEKSYANDLRYEWYRKEENWFGADIPNARMIDTERDIWISESHVIIVLYKCITKKDEKIIRMNSFRLYVDRVPRKERDVSSLCLPPKCKPYASVLHAHCDTVELNITYPRSQHGYNRSTSIWGNILCNDEIGGFQIWVVGHGILKRFLPHDIILIEKLHPGRAYCFNGWAYNSCGAGPVFTLEGVCAVNNDSCYISSQEHCERDSSRLTSEDNK